MGHKAKECKRGTLKVSFMADCVELNIRRAQKFVKDRKESSKTNQFPTTNPEVTERESFRPYSGNSISLYCLPQCQEL